MRGRIYSVSSRNIYLLYLSLTPGVSQRYRGACSGWKSLPFYLPSLKKLLEAAQWHLVRVLMPVRCLSRERKDLGGQGEYRSLSGFALCAGCARWIVVILSVNYGGQ